MYNNNQYCFSGDEDSVVLRLGPPGQQYPNHNPKPTSTKPSSNHELNHPLTNPNDGVTVALHIGPPSSDKETLSGGNNQEGLTARQGQYWIPSLSQILVGPTQFSCSVCNKTFNRFNNMQVETDDLLIITGNFLDLTFNLYLSLYFHVSYYHICCKLI